MRDIGREAAVRKTAQFVPLFNLTNEDSILGWKIYSVSIEESFAEEISNLKLIHQGENNKLKLSHHDEMGNLKLHHQHQIDGMERNLSCVKAYFSKQISHMTQR